MKIEWQTSTAEARIMSELAACSQVDAVKKFKDADEEYKKEIRTQFGGFQRFVKDYVERGLVERDAKFQSLYKKARKKDLSSRGEQFRIVSELRKSSGSFGERIDSKASSDPMYRETVETAFGFKFDKFREICLKCVS